MTDLLSNEQPEGSLDASVDSVLDKLGDSIVDEAPPETTTESAPTSGEDAGEEAGDAQDPSAASDTGESPAIEPPSGLTDDEREVFKSLPPAAQKMIERRERDRTTELRRGQDEVANKTKATEQERQRLAQAADQFIQLASTVDPIIAEGRQLDWAKLAAEDPAGYVQKNAAYQQRLGYLQAAVQQSQQFQAQQRSESMAREEAALLTKIPEWRDPAKGAAAMEEIRKAAVDSYGFQPHEVATLPDHRMALVLKDALAFRKMQAAQRTAQAKQVVVVPKVQKPGSGESAAQDRAKAMMQRVRSAGSLEEKADRIAALIQQG